MTKQISIVIIDYPFAMQSAVHGLKELFVMANDIASSHQFDAQFTVNIATPDEIASTQDTGDVIILPPAISGNYYKAPATSLLSYLTAAHQHGSILCSACAGAFILANTTLLNHRAATTHWQLAEDFTEQFHTVNLAIESLLINDGDVITAGGIMSWVDLGLELVAQFTRPQIMRALGKFLIVDTGKREQRYYGSFTPSFNHGNTAILQVQHYIQTHFDEPLCIKKLADLAHMSERTFLRQFSSATSFKPVQYIQRVRVQKACDLLETTTQSFEQIALNIGYEDVNSFRKVFMKIIGLSPTAFKARFV
ncbi:MAG: GlxA family transcriptional regulator [Psychrobium sp.]